LINKKKNTIGLIIFIHSSKYLGAKVMNHGSDEDEVAKAQEAFISYSGV